MGHDQEGDEPLQAGGAPLVDLLLRVRVRVRLRLRFRDRVRLRALFRVS